MGIKLLAMLDTACLRTVFDRPPTQFDGLWDEIGQRVKFIRQARKISVQEVADALNLTRSSVSNFESGRHKLPLEALLQIKNMLEVSLLDIVPEDHSAPSVQTLQDANPDRLKKFREGLASLSPKVFRHVEPEPKQG
jgi:transcriptional regulator with XRE-family HTH domain